MDDPKPTPHVSSRNFWRKVFQTMWSTRLLAMKILLPFLVIPFVIIEYFLGSSAVKYAASFAEKGQLRQLSGNLLTQVNALESFFQPALSCIVLTGIIIFISKMALIHQLSFYFAARPPEAAWSSVRAILLRTPALLLGIVLWFFLLGVTIQIFAGVAILILAPAVMLPALLVLENKGALRTAYNTLTMQYASGIYGGRLAAFFQCATIVAAMYLMFVGYFWLPEGVRIGFMHLSTQVEPTSVGAVPLHYIVSAVLKSIGLASIIWFTASASTTLFYWIRILHTIGIRRSV